MRDRRRDLELDTKVIECCIAKRFYKCIYNLSIAWNMMNFHFLNYDFFPHKVYTKLDVFRTNMDNGMWERSTNAKVGTTKSTSKK